MEKVTAEEALARANQAGGYEGYFWYLLAADLGEGEAKARSSMMEDAELVAIEDVRLAHYQLACWYAAGEQVAHDAKKARSHLRAALAPAKLRLDKDLSRAITRVREHFGLPEVLDLERPLGPAMPDLPGNIGQAQLEGTAAPLRGPPPAAAPRTSKPLKALKPVEDACAVAFSPDGRWLLSVGHAGEVFLWDAQSRAPTRKLKPVYDTSSIHFSSSGGRAVLSSDACTVVTLLDIERNALTELKGHQCGAAARFIATDTQIVTADDGGKIWIWDVATRKPVAKYAHGCGMTSMTVSPDGRYLVVGDAAYKTCVYTLPDLAPVATMDHHTHLIHGLSFDVDGRRLLSASRDDTIALWDVGRATLVRVLRGHTGAVYAAHFTRDGGAVSCALDGRLLRWNLETGASTELGRYKPLHSLAIHGDLVVSGGDYGGWKIPPVQFHDLASTDPSPLP